MSTFGEIRSIDDHELCPSEASVVEFNDVRCARRALDYIQQYHVSFFMILPKLT